MSSQNDLQNQNSTPESDESDYRRDTPAFEHSDERRLNTGSLEPTPLPVFDQLHTEDESLVKKVSDKLPQLEAVLRNEAPPVGSPPPQPVYQVKPAQSNWEDYPVPSVEETLIDEDEEAESGWQTVWAVAREIGETILLTLIIFFLIQLVIRNFRVVGTSMNDNLQDGQYLIIDKLTYSTPFEWMGWGGAQHGDVIVFEPPNHPGEDYVKRVVALPGETVEVRDGKVYVNGVVQDEPFLPKTPAYMVPPVKVPEDHVYVLGDNRNNSNDSHNWGALPVENIVGRAWLSYWPPDLWGTIPRDEPTSEATLRVFLQGLVPSASAESE
jgi:signal peptidase I